MKILVTGSQGFIGSRLVPALLKAGHDARGPELECLDFESVERAVRSEKWDTAIHLAALSHVPTCEREPAKAYSINLGGTALLLEALRRHSPEAHLIFASTAQVYAGAQAVGAAGSGAGAGAGSGPWDESRPIEPQNTYARTKRSAEVLITDACARGQLGATILRLFNHTHRSQAPDFFLPHIYSQLKDNSPGSRVTVPVGNLDLYRDIGSVQDLIAAFTRAVELPRAGGMAGMAGMEGCEIFNICSGTKKHLATLARELARRLEVDAEFVTDPARVRPGEPREILGSCEKFRHQTGWKPACESEKDLLGAFLADA